MADFVKPTGSAGTWSQEDGTLTITLGEDAQLLLRGGGPPGKEKLVIGTGGMITAGEVQEIPWDVPNERVFDVKPKQAGEFRLQAWVPNGPPYTRLIRVIVLPRKPSSLGAENIILFTETTAEAEEDGDLIGVYQRAAHSPTEVEVVDVQSYPQFVKFLDTFRDTGRRIGKLQVFGHGWPGVVWLGNDPLNTAHVLSLQGKGYHTVFAPNAAVFFSGCLIAEGRDGLELLKAFGQTFLFNGGGSVAASTSLGHSFGGLGVLFANGKIYHFSGTTKRLYFNTAGKVEKTEGIDDQADLDFLRG